MIVLDTDHLSALQFAETEASARLAERLQQIGPREVATTIVTVEEQMRGWLAAIHGQSAVARQVVYYERLQLLLRFFTEWTVLPFDEAAAREFDELRKQRIRVGTMDLKIAAIVRVRGATLLSANLSDFSRIPGLQVEDWLQS